MKRTTSAMLAASAVATLLVPTAASAALSPYWQSSREIAVIVNDQRVHDALKYEEAILSVRSTAPNAYEVATEHCTLPVRIVDKPAKPGLLGPRPFDIAVGQATCR